MTSRPKPKPRPTRERTRGTASCVCPTCGGPTRVLRTARTAVGTVSRQRICRRDHRFTTEEIYRVEENS